MGLPLRNVILQCQSGKQIPFVLVDKNLFFKDIPARNISLAVGILVTVHFFGLIGLLIPQTRSFFEIATPLNLLLSAGLLLYFHQDWRFSFILFMFVVMLTGFSIEVIGVKTKLIFGDYTYKTSLGFKFLDVPVIIGVNWLILIYAVGTVLYPLKVHFLVKSLLAAALMTGMDFLIEPVAVFHHYWDWAGSKIPIKNYLGWFVVSFALQCLFYLLPFHKKNPLALYLLVIQLTFFLLLQTGHYFLAQTF